MVTEAAARVHDLLGYGVPFDRDLEGHLVTSREAAHSQNRVVRVRGDMAGRAIMEALVATVRATPSIRVLENAVAEELVVAGRTVRGAIARFHGAVRRRAQMSARATVIASGGVGNLYAVTTNPAEARGGGLGMAARAGATIADPEFVQFHPTAIDVGKDPAPLATEALRGEGCALVNRTGERFMLKIDPAGELAPRDIVARGIFREVAAGRGAFLDCRTAVGEKFAEEFPTVYGYCRDAGIDPVRDLIPVVPAAHYHMGGIFTDAEGRTSLDGLWACGEAASTGAHGANRLASNSLLEAVVFSARIADDIGGLLPIPASHAMIERPEAGGDEPKDAPASAELRRLMSDHVGVIRNRTGLVGALRRISAMQAAGSSPRFANTLAAAKLIAAAALQREESRGGHFRDDFPGERADWRHRTFLTLADADRIAEGAIATEIA
jgi:L-aspartate oxidase